MLLCRPCDELRTETKFELLWKVGMLWCGPERSGEWPFLCGEIGDAASSMFPRLMQPWPVMI